MSRSSITAGWVNVSGLPPAYPGLAQPAMYPGMGMPMLPGMMPQVPVQFEEEGVEDGTPGSNRIPMYNSIGTISKYFFLVGM